MTHLPGFSAHASLYKTKQHYITSARSHTKSGGKGVVLEAATSRRYELTLRRRPDIAICDGIGDYGGNCVYCWGLECDFYDEDVPRPDYF